MTTLQDIAKLAGVNVSTVSKALRNSSEINIDTAKKIWECANRLNYIPRSSRTQEETTNGLIGIICPEILSNFYAQIITELSTRLSNQGYQVLCGLTDFKYAKEVEYLDIFAKTNRLKGIICLTEDKLIGETIRNNINEYKIPVLQVAMSVKSSEYDNICIDEEIGIEYAISHLVESGHRKIAFIGDSFSGSRLECFKNSLAKRNIPADPAYILIDSARYQECGYKLAGELLSLAERPTAIIAEYDDIAMGAIRRITEEGLKVPEDISVIGNDNAAYCPYLQKSLTTIDGHILEMSSIAVSMLLKKIEDPAYKVIQSVQIKPELVLRETSK